MKTAMRLAFEAAEVRKETDRKMVGRVLKVMERQDASAQRKRVRRASALPQVREQ